MLEKYLKRHRERIISELIELLKKPSISTDKHFKLEIEKTAEAVEKLLKEAGINKTEVCETEGIPIVYGEYIIDETKPTILIYGHYDVQPPDPKDLWDSPPFNPVIKTTEQHPQGAIFSRGASDDKGQMFVHIKAVEYLIKNKKASCNIKFLIEGEEEIGSPSLELFLKQNKKRLQNDIIIVSDTAMIANDIPSITTGLKGLTYLEIEVTGPNRDLHSGIYGGTVANPINVLTKLLASLQDENNMINIPGFYDDVKIYSEKEREEIAMLPFSLTAYKKELEIEEEQGEKGYSTNERNAIRPTLDINGIWGGYTGEGSKTVLPSKAYAKLSIRLVPNQNWETISELVKNHLEKTAPKSVKIKITKHHGGNPYELTTNNKGYVAAKKAYKKAFNKNPLPQKTGGSIPIVSVFEKELFSKTVLMGFGLDTDSIHSPNEHYGLFNLFKGIETAIYFHKEYEKLTKPF